MNNLKNLQLQFNSLAIFRNLLASPVIKKLEALIFTVDNAYCDSAHRVRAYSDFVSELYQHGSNLSDYIYNFVIEDENFYIKSKAKGLKLDDTVENALTSELAILQNLSRLTSDTVKSFLDYDGFLPDWNISEHDFTKLYENRIENVSKQGFGIFSKYHMFAVSDGNIVPVKHPDSQSLSSFSSYERERNLVIKNTLTLINGDKASNVLLYGDAGTGKSSTIKAVVNQYKDEGLRLVEVKKHQLFGLPDILEELAENPLKFIIFIDDLSFSENDDNFTALKALLEGSVTAMNQNIVIYATSNRRNLVKEQYLNRASSDDLRVNDTLQETASLSARFGLIVTFQKPDKDTYLSIATDLAASHGVPVDEQFYIKAEAFALRNNGRSPRAAKQFVELQKSGI